VPWWGILLFLNGLDEGPYDGDGRDFQGKEPEGSDKSVQGEDRRGRDQGEGWGVVDGRCVIWEGHVDICVSHDSTQNLLRTISNPLRKLP